MEIWDLYDEQGNNTGETWERSRAQEIPEGRYHIVCDVLIRHRDGSFLLTLRDPRKEMYPGCWEASAGGSALAGETPEEGARREMLETDGPFLLDCHTGYEEHVLPMIPPGGSYKDILTE